LVCLLSIVGMLVFLEVGLPVRSMYPMAEAEFVVMLLKHTSWIKWV